MSHFIEIIALQLIALGVFILSLCAIQYFRREIAAVTRRNNCFSELNYSDLAKRSESLTSQTESSYR